MSANRYRSGPAALVPGERHDAWTIGVPTCGFVGRGEVPGKGQSHAIVEITDEATVIEVALAHINCDVFTVDGEHEAHERER
jgi:hypothetical protein